MSTLSGDPPGYPGARDPGSGRRTRRGVIGVLFVLCFLAGLAVAGFAARRFGWFGAGGTAVTAAAAPATAAPATAAAPPATAMLPALAAREAALSAQVSALEARSAAVSADVSGAGDRAGRAEAVLTVAAARRRVERGEPLGYLEDQLRARFPAERGVADLLIRAARGVPTLDALNAELDALAPGLLGGPTDEALGERLRRELGGLVVLRRAGTPTTTPAEHLARARRLLAAGRVEAASAEASMLPGASRLGGWQAAARRYLLARRALDALERAVLSAPALPPPAPSAATPAPVPDPLLPAR